jgi:hypothetical protein
MSNPEGQYYNYPGYPQPQRGQHEQGWQPLPPPYRYWGPLQMNSAMFPLAAQPPQSPTTSLPVSAWRESPNHNEAHDGTRYRHLGDGPSVSYNPGNHSMLHQESSYIGTSSALSRSRPDLRPQPAPAWIPFESQIKPVYGHCPPHLQPTSNEVFVASLDNEVQQTRRRPSTRMKPERRQYPSRAEYVSVFR